VVLDGDYYVRLKLGPTLSRRTRTVFQTADPHFDESWPNLLVPHYRASLILELIDAGYDRAVGRVELPVFKLLQMEADALAEGRPRRKGQEDDYSLRDNNDREVQTDKKDHSCSFSPFFPPPPNPSLSPVRRLAMCACPCLWTKTRTASSWPRTLAACPWAPRKTWRWRTCAA
jgi:hypothetical protein